MHSQCAVKVEAASRDDDYVVCRQVRLGGLTDLQQEAVLDVLTQHFCKKDSRYLQYTMDVLFAEMVIRIHMHFLGLDYPTAEQLLEQL
eukprot:m.833460 g.833460  ORF g.833460 m.833460 type:complete len:88 (+) comp59465_c0_seq67:3290-3553(+)